MPIYRIRFNFILAQAVVHILFAGALTLFNLKGSHNFLGIIAFWYVLSYIYIFYRELKTAPDFHPFLILLLSSVQFVGLNGLSSYVKLLDGQTFKFGIYSINAIMASGIFYVSLQHLLLYTGYCLAERYTGRNEEETNDSDTIYQKVMYSDYPYFKTAIYAYRFVWIMRGVNLFIPLASLGSLANNIAASGHIIALYLLVFAKIQNPHKTAVMRLHWMIVIFEIALVLGMGMKELIISNLVPYTLLLLLQYHANVLQINKTLLLKLGILFFFVVNVFIYISVFRDLANKKQTEWANISVSDAFSGYADYIMGDGMYATDDKEEGKGLDYLLSRAGTIGCNAWSIDYAQTKSTKPDYLYYCSMGLIPRILWLNKPNLQTGGMMYRLATGHEGSWNRPIEKNICSISIGFIGSCYFSLGFWGAMIIPLLMGIFINLYWMIIKRHIHDSIVALWAFMALVSLFLKDCESLQDCGMVFTAWSCAYMLIIKLVHSIPVK